GDWCVSHQVWAGQPVPVARCLDCGQLAVGAGDAEPCGKCMGVLRPDDTVLDARFVAAVAVVAGMGWPDNVAGPEATAAGTTLVVNERGIGGWAVPMAGLCLRLSGTLPFCSVAVQDVVRRDVTAADGDGLGDAGDFPSVRTALVAGDLDVEAARLLLEIAADPPPGPTDLGCLAETCAAAFGAGVPGAALSAIATALGDGVLRGSGPEPVALLAPITAA
ncbi:MAG: valyl-tRNA synthetase, partial [Acidimicrobiaceae bacterium]|nr:valyl-tRNA synthetase [Acidimicrobiaceae bacterium]